MKIRNRIKNRYLGLLLLLTIWLPTYGVAHASEFEIDEIITAIKNEIKTADIAELGDPKFTIEAVDVALTVFSTETEKGALAVKVAGFSYAFDDTISPAKSYQNLSFSFKPTESSDFSSEISLGLVDPIIKVKSSLKKAFNTPPNFKMEKFKFKFEFAIEEDMDEGIRFKILELENVKAQNIATHRLTVHLKITN